MKKMFKMLLVCGLCFGLFGCSSNEEKQPDSENGDKVSEKDKQDIILVESGYSFKESNFYLKYGVQINNPNSGYAVKYPKILITAYKEDGSVLASEEQVLSMIAPNDNVFYGGQIDCKGEEPAKVEFKTSQREGDFVSVSESVNTTKLVVSNTSEIIDGEYYSYTGEVENQSDKDLSSVAVTVILREGNTIVYGDTTYLDDLNKGLKKSFEFISNRELPNHTSYEIHVQTWGYN